MNTKLLKQKILDLAIRGKLTQQLKSDGTAKDLLTQISDERRKTRDERKGTRSKKSGVILSEAQSAKSKDLGQIIPLDKSDAPFEIPENWEWVKLGNVCSLNPADKLTDDMEVSFVPMANIGAGFENRFISEVRSWNSVKSGFTRFANGDIAVAKITPCFENRKSVIFENLKNGFGAGTTELHILRTFEPVFNKYIFWYVKSEYFIQNGIGHFSGAVGQQRVGKDVFFNACLPLPPIAEQQRIVAKIEEAFAEIDAVEKNKELLKTHIKQTRQKILDLAIHGKLVPQNKSDEPASVLLERITRDNPHYEKLIDIPFEIPDSWEWVKLGDVCKPIKRGKSPKYIEHSNVLVFAQKCNQKDGPVSLEKALYLDESTLNKYPKEEFLQKGDVVINSTGTGTLGRVGYFNVDLPQNIKGIVPDSHVTTIRSFYVNPYYLYCFLKNKQTYLEENGEGSTNQKELKPHTIYDLEFPLPPLAEQKRIVDRIEEIFASLDEISLHLV